MTRVTLSAAAETRIPVGGRVRAAAGREDVPLALGAAGRAPTVRCSPGLLAPGLADAVVIGPSPTQASRPRSGPPGTSVPAMTLTLTMARSNRGGLSCDNRRREHSPSAGHGKEAVVFDHMVGVRPEQAARWAALVEESRPILESDGMEAVQALLVERGMSTIQAIVITRALLGNAETPLQVAIEIVATSKARQSF